MIPISRIGRVIASVVVLAAAAMAIEVQKVPRIQPAGLLTMRALASQPGAVITWKVTSYFVDESSGAVSYAADSVTYVADTVRAVLTKLAGKYTFYKFVAQDSGGRDSAVIQAFTKGVPQKYLYRSPYVPSKPIPVYVILPATFSTSSKFVLTMHGTDRNALSYVAAWKDFALAQNYVAAAPEFNSTDWSSTAYNLGNMFTGSDGAGSLVPQKQWTYSIVQDIHRDLVNALGLRDSLYCLWGHSAGAQFVHRLMLFVPDPLVRIAIPGNAGWYSCPDTAVSYPWGVKHPLLSYPWSDLTAYVHRNMVIMRGTADTLRDADLNIDPLSDVQGLNRYQRAGYFYGKGLAVDPSATWKLVDVPGIGHSYGSMAKAAGEYLANLSAVSPVPSRALPRAASLSCYPNPFNPATTLEFSVPDGGHVTMTVFTLLGEQVKTLVDGPLAPGHYSVQLNAGGLASGMYLCRLTTGRSSSSAKLLLLR